MRTLNLNYGGAAHDPGMERKELHTEFGWRNLLEDDNVEI
jgi:hypothetical protein